MAGDRLVTPLIGIDWGSTNLRAFRFGEGGEVAETRTSPSGITTIADGAFEPVLAAIIRGWTDDRPPILMAGMIGSRNGWREAAYAPCPADAAQLAAMVLPVETTLGACRIVPGLMVRSGDRPADVMRGEETKALGSGVRDGVVLMPGTHPKWAVLEGGAVVRFRTAMTGELYAILLKHSLLGRLVEDAADDDDAFERGARRALADPALSMLLFSARAEVLTGGLSGAAVPSYLSGMLIGAEIGAMAAAHRAPLTMVGDPGLCARYARVLAFAGIEDVTVAGGDAATARGLWTIGKELR